jgi:hypothetical protein
MSLRGIGILSTHFLSTHFCPSPKRPEKAPGLLTLRVDNLKSEEMESHVSRESYLTAPERLTPAAFQFLCEYQRICGFVFYVTHLATGVDERSRIANRALYERTEPERYQEGLETIESRGAVMELRSRHRTIVLEMMLSRGVENFLTYLSELLGMIFRIRPETMRSSDTVRLDAVLRHSSMDEFISYLAEKRVSQLSYQGMKDLSSYLSKSLSFTILPEKQDLDNAVRIIECRNLIVHNRGIVNAIFCERLAGVTTPIGKPLGLEYREIQNDIGFLTQCVFFIDALAVKKSDLETMDNPKKGARILLARMLRQKNLEYCLMAQART